MAKHRVARNKTFLVLLRHWRLVLFAILVVGAAIAYRATGLRSYFEADGMARARADMLALGWRGKAIYLAVYTLFVTLGLPNLPFQLAAGAIYGLWPAYAMMLFGVNLGALTAFLLARLLGRRGIEDLFSARLQKLNEVIEGGGFRYLIILRMVPLMPFNLINYAAGVSRVRTSVYLAANFVGMLPLTFVHILIGNAAGHLDLTDPASWKEPKLVVPIVVALLMFLAAVVAARSSARKARRRR